MTKSTPNAGSSTPEHDYPYEYEGVRYRWRLTREAIDETMHYCHIIPIGRGWTGEHFAKHYPGGSLNLFMAVYKAAGIRLAYDGLGSAWGGRCHWRLKHLYLTDSTSFAVEWDETITEDDRRYFWTGRRNEEQTGNGSVVVKLTDDDYETPGRITEIAGAIAHELGGADTPPAA